MVSDFSKSLVNFVEFYSWFETLKILGCIFPQLNSGFPCSSYFCDFLAGPHITSNTTAGEGLPCAAADSVQHHHLVVVFWPP